MRRALADASLVTLSVLIRQILAFASSIVAARILPVREFSVYLLAISATVVLIPLTDAGMSATVTRLAARRPDAGLFGFTRAANRKRGPLWALICAGVVAAVPLAGVPTAAVLMLAAIGAMGQAVLDSMCGELFGRRRFAPGAALRITSGVTSFAGMPILLVGPHTATLAMVPFAAARVLPAMICLLVTRPMRIPDPEIAWRVSYKFALSTTLMVAYVRSDLFLLAAYQTSPRSLAVYGAVYNVLTAVQAVPAAIGSAAYPRVVAAPEGRWRVVASTMALVSFGLSVGISAALIAFPHLALLPFGSQYADGAAHVRLLFLTLIPISISQVLITSLQGRGKESVTLRLLVVTAVVNIGGNAVAIPLFGVHGAAGATYSAEFVSAIGSVLLVGLASGIWRGIPIVAASLVVGVYAQTDLPALGDALCVLGIAALAVCLDWFDCRTLLVRARRGRGGHGTTVLESEHG